MTSAKPSADRSRAHERAAELDDVVARARAAAEGFRRMCAEEQSPRGKDRIGSGYVLVPGYPPGLLPICYLATTPEVAPTANLAKENAQGRD